MLNSKFLRGMALALSLSMAGVGATAAMAAEGEAAKSAVKYLQQRGISANQVIDVDVIPTGISDNSKGKTGYNAYVTFSNGRDIAVELDAGGNVERTYVLSGGKEMEMTDFSAYGNPSDSDLARRAEWVLHSNDIAERRIADIDVLQTDYSEEGGEAFHRVYVTLHNGKDLVVQFDDEAMFDRFYVLNEAGQMQEIEDIAGFASTAEGDIRAATLKQLSARGVDLNDIGDIDTMYRNTTDEVDYDDPAYESYVTLTDGTEFILKFDDALMLKDIIRRSAS